MIKSKFELGDIVWMNVESIPDIFKLGKIIQLPTKNNISYLVQSFAHETAAWWAEEKELILKNNLKSFV